MRTQRTFAFTFSVHAPLAAVAGFHPDRRALQRLTPLPTPVQFHRVEPLGEGSLADFTLWFGPWPMHWVAVHSQVDRLHGFTGTQQCGPRQFWQHTPRFDTLDPDTTRVMERVQYAYYPSWRGLLGRVLFHWLTLRRLFRYRCWVTRRALDTKPG